MTATKKKNPKKAKAAPAKKAKRLGALDAAARVLAEAGESMTAKELIEAMAEKSLWESPGGKTPHATLFAAIIREIANKGRNSRFKKTAPGQFAATPKACGAEERPAATTAKPKAAKKAEPATAEANPDAAAPAA
jgi:hypothetical protein